MEEKQNPCGESDGIDQRNATKEKPRTEKYSRHQSGSQNWRAVLHDSDISDEREQRQCGRQRQGKSQHAAEPPEKSRQGGDVKAREYKHVKCGSLLESFREVGIHKIAVAEEHGAQNGDLIRLAGVELTDSRKKVSARACQMLRY